MPEVRKFIEFDPATGDIVHSSEIIYNEPNSVLEGDEDQASFRARVDQMFAAVKQEVAAKGRGFLRTHNADPLAEITQHRVAGGQIVKRGPSSKAPPRSHES